METCSACIEKDKQFKSRDIEFTKIEKIFKEQCHEMLENEKLLKEKEKELTQKCENLEKENKILKQQCSADCNDCVQKDKIILELKVWMIDCMHARKQPNFLKPDMKENKWF
ncbi:hypothetical protein Hanom_Chr10g00923391 [Helianthus anomalus]